MKTSVRSFSASRPEGGGAPVRSWLVALVITRLLSAVILLLSDSLHRFFGSHALDPLARKLLFFVR